MINDTTSMFLKERSTFLGSKTVSIGRLIVTIVLVTLSLSISAQKELWFQAPPGATISFHPVTPKLSLKGYNWREALVSGTLGLKGGVFNAYHEVLTYHYPQFQERHLHANPNFWNPDISWQNKWKNGDKTQGPKYPLSNNVLAWTTDGIHPIKRLRFLAYVELGAAITFGERRPWWHYAINALSGFVGNQLGFALIYKKIYR